MCGRFTVLTAPRVKLKGVRDPELPFEARYNIAPTQQVLVFADLGRGLELTKLVWGLIPARSVDGRGFINVRAETITQKASFRESFQKRRCLVPADGFFEWKRSGRAKQAFYFHLVDGSPFAFAGIWDRWLSGRELITSFAIITTAANPTLKPIHDRMPAILSPDSYDTWLDPQSGVDSLCQLLVPFAAAKMTSYPVSSAVNYPENDNPGLLDRVDNEVGTTPSLF